MARALAHVLQQVSQLIVHLWPTNDRTWKVLGQRSRVLSGLESPGNTLAREV